MRYASIEELLEALYATISGPAGPRRWTRERELFHPLARLMRTGVDADGRRWIRIMSVTEYIADVAPFLAGRDFYEVEVAREIDRFGNIAQVRSVYQAYTTPPDNLTAPDAPGATQVPVLPQAKKGPGLRRSAPCPERRGVNLLQCYHDGERWWVLSVLWDNERDGVAIPETWRAPAPERDRTERSG